MGWYASFTIELIADPQHELKVDMFCDIQTFPSKHMIRFCDCEKYLSFMCVACRIFRILCTTGIDNLVSVSCFYTANLNKYACTLNVNTVGGLLDLYEFVTIFQKHKRTDGLSPPDYSNQMKSTLAAKIKSFARQVELVTCKDLSSLVVSYIPISFKFPTFGIEN